MDSGAKTPAKVDHSISRDIFESFSPNYGLIRPEDFDSMDSLDALLASFIDASLIRNKSNSLSNARQGLCAMLFEGLVTYNREHRTFDLEDILQRVGRYIDSDSVGFLIRGIIDNTNTSLLDCLEGIQSMINGNFIAARVHYQEVQQLYFEGRLTSRKALHSAGLVLTSSDKSGELDDCKSEANHLIAQIAKLSLLPSPKQGEIDHKYYETLVDKLIAVGSKEDLMQLTDVGHTYLDEHRFVRYYTIPAIDTKIAKKLVELCDLRELYTVSNGNINKRGPLFHEILARQMGEKGDGDTVNEMYLLYRHNNQLSASKQLIPYLAKKGRTQDIESICLSWQLDVDEFGVLAGRLKRDGDKTLFPKYYRRVLNVGKECGFSSEGKEIRKYQEIADDLLLSTGDANIILQAIQFYFYEVRFIFDRIKITELCEGFFEIGDVDSMKNAFITIRNTPGKLMVFEKMITLGHKEEALEMMGGVITNEMLRIGLDKIRNKYNI